jgi:hypothetical protein
LVHDILYKIKGCAFGFGKMLENSSVAEQMLAYQEGLGSME